MDLQGYYQKIHQIEAEISEPHAVLVSFETVDGGRAGVRTEATRATAARMVVDGRARLATPEETAVYLEEKRAEYERAQQEAAVARLPVAFLTENDVRVLKGAVRTQKTREEGNGVPAAGERPSRKS